MAALTQPGMAFLSMPALATQTTATQQIQQSPHPGGSLHNFSWQWQSGWFRGLVEYDCSMVPWPFQNSPHQVIRQGVVNKSSDYYEQSINNIIYGAPACKSPERLQNPMSMENLPQSCCKIKHQCPVHQRSANAIYSSAVDAQQILRTLHTNLAKFCQCWLLWHDVGLRWPHVIVCSLVCIRITWT